MGRFARLRGDHPLVAYIDLKSPYAYLAIDPTRAMARAAGVTIDWRPFTLDIPSYLGAARLDEKGAVASSQRTPEQWSGVRYAYMDARRYANLCGKTVRGTVKIWNSSLAGVSMLWARRQGRIDRYLDEIYPRFWRRELDIEDVGVLEGVLRDAGVSADGFREYVEGPGRAEHDELNGAAFAAGIFGVPSYLVGDEMWFGREHLPRVAWLLAGATGPAPDVANRSFTAASTAGPEARGGAGRLSVLLDLRSPACYLALSPALAFADELRLVVDWLPLTVPPPRRPSDPRPDDHRGVLHRRHRARAMAREIETYARAQGLVLRDPYRDPDPGAFNLGWLWLRERDPRRLPAFLREGFRAYWSLELDPSSLPAVASLLESIGAAGGAEFRGWSSHTGPETAARLAADLRDRGLAAVPGYLVDGEYFQGRQHLPMIRWILAGRRGAGPI